jgi:hypothetical protein
MARFGDAGFEVATDFDKLMSSYYLFPCDGQWGIVCVLAPDNNCFLHRGDYLYQVLVTHYKERIYFPTLIVEDVWGWYNRSARLRSTNGHYVENMNGDLVYFSGLAVKRLIREE